MHKKIEQIKKLESPPKVLKDLYKRDELEKFLRLYHDLPITVHNKKQNVIKKRWLKNFNQELDYFYDILG